MLPVADSRLDARRRPELEVLILGNTRSVAATVARLPEPRAGVAYLLCRPVAARPAATAAAVTRPDLRCLDVGPVGRARLLNACLAHARGRRCVLSSVHIDRLPGWDLSVGESFAALPEATFLTFAIARPDGRPLRHYPLGRVAYGPRGVFGVTVDEVAFDLDRIRASGVVFNERLGIGTATADAEVAVFLRDLLKAGAAGWRIPLLVAVRRRPPRVVAGPAFLKPDQVEDLGRLAYCRWGGLARWTTGAQALRIAVAMRSPHRLGAIAYAYRSGIDAARESGLERICRLDGAAVADRINADQPG